MLEDQRKQWQSQATSSFQNKLTRNMSRSRSKSLTQNRVRRRANESQSNFDFLAARTFLGNQSIVPVIHPSRHERTVSQGTSVAKSHTNSNSLSKTISKVSKASKGSHHQGHSRNASWSKSALKMAKSTPLLCGINDEATKTPMDEKASALESVLRGNSTTIIRLADPALSPADSGSYGRNSRNGLSPTPSAEVGIALSTPLPSDDNHYDPEAIQLLNHPYAQGASYTPRAAAPISDPRHDSPRGGSDYAGPHLTHTHLASVSTVDNTDVSMRHRLPPQAFVHPYAHASVRDSYQGEHKIIPVPRTDSNVPPASKMWAPLSSGEVREVLPDEIQYSPFIPQQSHFPGSSSPSRDYTRSSTVFPDTVAVGEALAYATMRKLGSRDSGLGTSENHDMEPPRDVEILHTISRMPSRTQVLHRKPVQYDASQPPYHQVITTSSDPSSNHFDASSPPAESNNYFRTTSPLRPDTSHTNSGSSPNVHSEMTSESSSPQLSPRRLGSLDDLEHFQDLFVPWDVGSHGRRTGSGLTSLARQLTDDFEELNAQRARSRTPESIRTEIRDDEGLDDDVHFVASEAPQELSNLQTTSPLRIPGNSKQTAAFQASEILPEDVGSSGESSPTSGSPIDEDETVRECNSINLRSN